MREQRRTRLIAGTVTVVALTLIFLFATAQPTTTLAGRAFTAAPTITFAELPALISGPTMIQATTTDTEGHAVAFSVDGEPYGPVLRTAPFITLVDSSQFSTGPHIFEATLINEHDQAVASDRFVFEIAR